MDDNVRKSLKVVMLCLVVVLILKDLQGVGVSQQVHEKWVISDVPTGLGE